MGHKERKFTFFLRTEREKWPKTGAFARHIHVHLSIGSTPPGVGLRARFCRREIGDRRMPKEVLSMSYQLIIKRPDVPIRIYIIGIRRGGGANTPLDLDVCKI